jgi:hypothetical protein
VCTAHATGSTRIACSSENPSGTGCSWLRCAASCWPQPPPVSLQNPVCRPGERWPTVIRSHRLVSPAAHATHGSTPRAAQVSTGSTTTRVPFGRSSQSSSSSATTSCPGTNGSDTTAEKYRLVRPDSAPRSDPQMPDSRVRSRTQPGRSTRGSSMVTSRSGAANPDSTPGIRPPIALPAMVRETDRNISSASIMSGHLPG